MNLKGKIAVLTGASSGLGSAVAESLIQKEAIVYGLARNLTALNELKKKLGESFHSVKIDITNSKIVSEWIKTTFSGKYAPDILINNAGVGAFIKIDETKESDWLTMMNTNLNGMFYITSGLVPFMKKKVGSKHIINIGSIIGLTGRAESAAYCTTKFGVQGFSESLFLELRFFNIKVTCFNPGSIATDFLKSSGIDKHDHMLHPKDLADTLIYILETPDNMLINELTVRPLNPKKP